MELKTNQGKMNVNLRNGFLILFSLCLPLAQMAQNLTIVPLFLKKYEQLPSDPRSSSLYAVRCDKKIQKMFIEVFNSTSNEINEMYWEKKYNDCNQECTLDCTLEVFSSSCTCEGVREQNSKTVSRSVCKCERDGNWENYRTTVTIKTTHYFNHEQSVKFKLSKSELFEPLVRSSLKKIKRP